MGQENRISISGLAVVCRVRTLYNTKHFKTFQNGHQINLHAFSFSTKETSSLPSLTIENYVKVIYQICSSSNAPCALTGELATALGISPSSVTSMLKTLHETGLAKYKPYEGVQLTASGNTLALRVLRRHRLIELFLVKTLDLNWDEVHEEAENMEHAVSDLLVDRIDQYLGHPLTDPHGDPIPAADGTVPTGSAQPLIELDVKTVFHLVRVIDQTPEFLRYLSETGLTLGTRGTITENQREAGTITLDIDGRATVLSHAAAEKLLVETFPIG